MTDLTHLIAEAIYQARANGLDKPHDLATCIQARLDAAGWRFARKPTRKTS